MSEKIILTDQQVLDLAREAVAEKGADYVYVDPTTGNRAPFVNFPSDPEFNPGVCVYVVGKESACLVGNILVRAGIEPEVLQPLGTDGATTALRILSDDITVSDEARMFLVCAQAAQDGGDTWGESLTRALTNLEHVK